MSACQRAGRHLPMMDRSFRVFSPRSRDWYFAAWVNYDIIEHISSAHESISKQWVMEVAYLTTPLEDELELLQFADSPRW